MRYLVGIGNYTMGDDGIGLRVAEEIERRFESSEAPPGLAVIEIAGNGLDLLPYFDRATEKMLWIDCVKFDAEPGTFAFFSADEVDSRKILARRSTHEGDLLQVLELARKLGYRIPRIDIMAIEPKRIGQGQGLSGVLESRLAEYVDVALARVLAG